MRKLIVLFTLIVACLGVNATVASAANCSNSTEAMTRGTSGGYQTIRYGVALYSCTGVDQIRFKYSGTGAIDYTEGGVQHQFYLAGGTSDVTIGGITEGGGGGIAGPGIAQTCWYGSGVMHSLRPLWYYQIHARGGAWGPIHFVIANNVGGGPYGITC